MAPPWLTSWAGWKSRVLRPGDSRLNVTAFSRAEVRGLSPSWLCLFKGSLLLSWGRIRFNFLRPGTTLSMGFTEEWRLPGHGLLSPVVWRIGNEGRWLWRQLLPPASQWNQIIEDHRVAQMKGGQRGVQQRLPDSMQGHQEKAWLPLSISQMAPAS